MSKNRVFVAFVLICMGVIGGIAPIFMKVALKEFSPIQIVFSRFFFASFVLFPIALITNNIRFKKQDIIRIVFASLLFSINIFCFVIGLQYTTSIASQLMYLLLPVFVILLTFVILKQPVTNKQLISIAIGFVGGFILMSRNTSDVLINSLGTMRGNLIVLCSVFSWALYAIVSKKLSLKYHPLSLLLVNCVITALLAAIALIYLQTDIVGLYSHASSAALMSLFLLVVLNSILYFFLFQWALKMASPYTVSLASYIGPLAAAAFAIPFFGERITPQLVISAVLIGISSYLTLKKTRNNSKY